ncbi:MAG: PEP-CTERM sorting domain-containing protein [Phycisphaerae bacterium]|nr:PEP-CTERM sorting domain-containing protein [Phycisphaerae bacterium]
MMNKRSALIAVLAAVVCVVQLPASAAVPWSNPAGANTRFGWSEGQNNDIDLFKSPTITHTGFTFDSIEGFRAERSSPTYPTSITDVTRVKLDVRNAVGGPAERITDVTIQEWGLWENTGADPSDSSIFNVQTNFRVAPLDAWHLPITQAVPVVYEYDAEDGGTWYGELTITIPYTDVYKFQIQDENILSVDDGLAGSYIEKLGVRIIVPEPGSLLLLASSCIALLRRSRRGAR